MSSPGDVALANPKRHGRRCGRHSCRARSGRGGGLRGHLSGLSAQTDQRDAARRLAATAGRSGRGARGRGRRGRDRLCRTPARRRRPGGLAPRQALRTSRGRGVGSRLHDAALARAAALGLEELDLWVLADNHRARHMYERRGWRLVPGSTLANDSPSVLDVLYEREVGRTVVD